MRVAMLLSVLAFPLFALAQEAPVNMTKVSQWRTVGDSYADVWGDGLYMYGAHYGQNKVDIVDISIPSAPMKVATYVCSTANSGASAQELAVVNGAMYVGLEANGNDSVEIVDVRNPFAPTLKRKIKLSNLNHVHNLLYDNGWLYLVDSRTQQVSVVDMRSFNIADPPGATITTAKWTINIAGNANGGSAFVHDIHVNNGRLYCCDWTAGLWVYDVSDVADQAPVFLARTQTTSCHSAHSTADNKWVVTCDERNGGALRLYEFKDGGPGNSQLILRDNFQIPTTRAICIHDAFFVADRLYCSWYHAGVQVLDLDRDTGRLHFVGSYDTTPAVGSGGYDGCWGVYPYLDRSKILASDIGTGLWVLRDDAPVIKFDYPDGLPEYLVPAVSTPLRVLVGGDAAPDAGSVLLRAKIDGGSSVDTPLTPGAPGEFLGSLPPVPCGSKLEYWVEATFGALGLKSDPPAGYGHFLAHPAMGFIPVFSDDFEVARGWSVSNIAINAGAWQRGSAVPTPYQPETDHTAAPGTSYYVTGLGAPTGVDGGPTILTSPVMDFSGGNGQISFYYWFFNDDGDDTMLLEITSNGVNWVQVQRLNGSGGGWRLGRFTVGDYVTPTASVQVRFSVADNPHNSVTEAAIDDFLAERFNCVSLTGKIELLSLAVSPAGRVVDIEFRAPGTTSVLASYPVTLDGAGNYAAPGVLVGTWDIAVKHGSWLRQTLKSVAIVNGSNSASFSLVNGDVDGSNRVDLLDLNLVLVNFLQAGSGDVDGNGSVDLSDLNITLLNFLKAGDP